MKRGKKMLFLLCALIVLIGAYFGVQQLNKPASVSETAGTFPLASHAAEDFDTIAWTNDGVSYSFRYISGTWKTTDEPAWPVQQDVIQGMADQLLSLEATRKLEDVKSMADYGLETPAFSVKVSWKDGTGATYSMGDATPFADGYYLSVSGQDSTVYTIASSLASAFNKTQKDMAAMESIPSVAEAVRLTVSGVLDAVKEAESKTVDPEQRWYDAATDEPLDGTQIESLVNSAVGIAWNELVSASATDEELVGWHLDEASATKLAVTGSDGSSLVLLIGAQHDSGGYYARLPESVMVYTVESSAVGSLLSASKDSMWIKAVLPLPYGSLASAELITEKGSYQLKKPAEETAEETDDAALKNLWAQVAGLKATERLDTEKTGDQVLSIHAVSTSGKESTVIFSEYSAESYQAVVDGGTPLLVSANDIDAIIRTVRTF
ncbi:MAG: DUF4340 domain-containing protein [Clostridia bacterium]|nr:DUF4340 domain-containing protein [Clostridia bacterium]